MTKAPYSSTAPHQPVMIRQVIEALQVKQNGHYLDCTGGYGGHAAAILDQMGPQGRLWVCDYHEPSVAGLKIRFQEFKTVQVKHRRFSQIFDKVDCEFDGILADLGVSSGQLDNHDLGIGFQLPQAPLDMRIDARLEVTAAEILRDYGQSRLADLFYTLGGERHSRRIAAAIVHDRGIGRAFETTDDLRGLCERVLGRFYRGKKIHPATKVFQALRLEVNRELEELKKFLVEAPERLRATGRLVVISFHEGEDRLVKERFRALAQEKNKYSLMSKKAIKPEADEIRLNQRARSARLRVLERTQL